jgi:GAF domain-containing protein
VRALGLVPLRIQGEPAGALIVGYHQPRRFSSGDVRYLSAAADSASVVADNILLLDQIQANLRETSVLYEATRALADAGTPADVLDIAQRYLGAGRVTQAFIALLNLGDWNLPEASVNVVASWQADENSLPLEGVTLSPEQFPAWSLLATPEVLAVSDTHADARVGPLEAVGLESLDFRAVAILPLRSAGRPIGALVFGAPSPSRPACASKPRAWCCKPSAAPVSSPPPRRSARSPARSSTSTSCCRGWWTRSATSSTMTTSRFS